jgi:hypothetical protein
VKGINKIGRHARVDFYLRIRALGDENIGFSLAQEAIVAFILEHDNLEAAPMDAVPARLEVNVILILFDDR